MSTPETAAQADLFPHRSPPTVAAYLERCRRRLARMADRMTPEDCARALGELALLERLLDVLEAHHERRAGAGVWRAAVSAAPPTIATTISPPSMSGPPRWHRRTKATA